MTVPTNKHVQQGKKSRFTNQQTLIGMVVAAIVAVAITLPLRNRLQNKTDQLRNTSLKQYALLSKQETLQNRLKRAALEVQSEPKDAPARAKLAYLLTLSGDMQNAETEWKEAIRLQPHNSSLYVGMGNAYASSDRLDLAIIAYQHATQLNPDDVDALVDLDSIYNRLEWWYPAETLMREAIARNPNSIREQLSYASSLYLSGDYRRAQSQLQAALKIWPHNERLLLPLAEVYRIEGDTTTAQNCVIDGMLHDENSTALLVEKAQIQLTMKQPEEALGTLFEVMRAVPGSLQIFYIEARAYQMMSRPDDALKYWKEVSHIQPDYRQTDKMMGTLLEQTGEVHAGESLLARDTAISNEKAVIQRLIGLITKNFSDWHAHLALAAEYSKQHKYSEAVVEYRQTLLLAPDNKSAKSGLKRTQYLIQAATAALQNRFAQ